MPALRVERGAAETCSPGKGMACWGPPGLHRACRGRAQGPPLGLTVAADTEFTAGRRLLRCKRPLALKDARPEPEIRTPAT